jgi:hypothetical protein
MTRSATASANTAVIACNEARGTAGTELQNACLASRGRVANARIVSQNARDASTAGGKVMGSILGGALFGRNNNQGVNLGNVYQCVVEVAGSCEKSVSSSRQVDVCP